MGVFSLAGWSRRIHTGFLVPRATQDTTMPALASGTEPSSSAARLSRRFPSQLRCKNVVLLPRAGPRTSRGLGYSPFARHYWGNHCCFLFLEVLRCFSSLRSPPRPVPGMTALQAAGLSHSETRGSKIICTSPRLIAAYRVLHRLREPRHPPCALSYFRLPGTFPTRGGAGAHTFSCIVEVFYVSFFLQSCLSNMSKISEGQ